MWRPSLRDAQASARPGTPTSARPAAGRFLAALTLVVAGGAIAPAASIVTDLHGTGENVPPGTAAADPFWRIVARPAGAASAARARTAADTAWVLSGTKGFPSVPDTWFPGLVHARRAAPVVPTGRWIGLEYENAVSLLPAAPYTGPGRYYTTVYSTTFTASEEGSAFLWLRTVPDNAVTFYVNGELADLDTDRPTIRGGSRLGSRVQGLSRLHTVAGTVDVTSGENTLFAVVEDMQGPSGSYGATGLLVIPEPSTGSGLGVVAAWLAWTAVKRRSRGRTRRDADGAASAPPRAAACNGSSAR